MRDACFLEDCADRLEALLEIEAFSGELRVQHRILESAASRFFHQEFENLSSDTGTPQFFKHRHASDFDFACTVRDESAASHRFAIEHRQGVHRVTIVFVEFDLLGNMLLLDEDTPANLVRERHLRGRSDQNDLQRRAHARSLTRNCSTVKPVVRLL